jgi:DNA-binding MarR family transcriptional regulator
MSNTSRRRAPRVARLDRVSPLNAHLGYWLRALSNHTSHSFKLKVEQHGVTVAEWVVMRALFDHEGSRPSELAATLGLTRGTVSKLIDRLAAKKLVVITADIADRRVQTLVLRPAGRRLVPKLAGLADQNDAEVFGHLPQKERAMLLSVLQDLVERLGLTAAPVE